MKQTKRARLLAWIRAHQRLVLILVGLIFITGTGATAAYLITEPLPPEQVVRRTAPPKDPVYHSLLTGVDVKNQKATTSPVTAIMIENSPDARPQSGLKNSGVVFEAIAEGGITRFLVLYQNEQPSLVGPVRSLRSYYVDWLAPFQASVAHVGGSHKALQEIRNGSYRDIDQFFNAGTYWRASDRYAPHNVYTNFSRINKLNKQKGYTKSSFTGFKRDDSEPAKKLTAKDISVTISSATYNSRYKYNQKTNTYNREQGGAKHLDREKGQISPRVVIVLKVEQHKVMEDGYRESIKTTGSGEAHIFQDGTVKKVTWKKASKKDQLVFVDSNGNDVPLARGQTWITAVPKGSGGVTWQ